MSRVFLTVLDAVGAGEAPDAADYGDVGTNTLGHVIAACDPKLQNMAALGLGRIPGTGYRHDGPVAGAFGRATEQSKGKDTTSGHWEIAGVRVKTAFPTFPEGFPADFIEAYGKAIGHKCIGNKPASGTAILEELGREHMENRTPIVYTSADSVFQIACHEEVSPRKSCMSSPGLPGKCSRVSWVWDGLSQGPLSASPGASSGPAAAGIFRCRPAAVRWRTRSRTRAWRV